MSFIQLQFDWKITKMTKWHSSAIQLPFQAFPLTFSWLDDKASPIHFSNYDIFLRRDCTIPIFVFCFVRINVVEHIDLYQLHVNFCTSRNGQILDVVCYSPLTKHYWKKAQRKQGYCILKGPRHDLS